MSHQQRPGPTARLINTIRVLTKIVRSQRSEIADLRKIISTLEAETNQLHTALEMDQLTGVYNRAGLHRAWRRNGAAITGVMLIDGDGFKKINDKHGHSVGDAVICTMADALASSTIIAARFGGDEFVGLIIDDDPYDAAARFAKDLSTPRVIEGCKITLTATIGLCIVDHDSSGHPKHNICDYLDKADEALYAGKEAGRNTIITTEIAREA